MKKILLFLSAVLLALLAPAYARAAVTPVVSQSAPVMGSFYAGSGLAMGFIHEEQMDELHKATESFVTYSGCRMDPEFKDRARNYMQDHPTSALTKDWIVGMGKAAGADYINVVDINLDSFHAPGFFHTTVEGMITTTVRTIRISDGETVLNAKASQEGKIEKTALQCALAAFENAKQVEKENHIIFVKK
ncbi:hypothetical protein [Dialister succinatiphilus]|uniref:hypothetical protein n=1 Tax=Dialister succinatiphilus TaxID=487173 RepID=UPI003F7E59A5